MIYKTKAAYDGAVYAGIKERMIVYECDICGCYHDWAWAGDCREDDNRLVDLPDGAEIRTMEERVEADERGEP